jgi:hypothetical protein
MKKVESREGKKAENGKALARTGIWLYAWVSGIHYSIFDIRDRDLGVGRCQRRRTQSKKTKNPKSKRKVLMPKKLRNYLIATVVVFLILLFVGVIWVDFTWGESALLSAFLTAIGVGGYWWREEGLG